ncbi:hypothetical protein PC110_g17567 [Phytophthora cactorum]|uniref:PiggyBac transposable element-derived protein domain-containing protein n=1 Tax=Phytophthora cactorum TaxID=29920 RepID=A0A329RNS8_9STRA|nr:hypothetical protein PC110_g17567 [Phytophthora cactorum]
MWHAVVIDRFYSSTLLAIELLGMNVHTIGTIMTNRIGNDANAKQKRMSRPQSIPRGEFTISRSVAVPSMVAFHWWDRKPVHYLCTGSVTASTIGRNIKQIGSITIPCPAAVNDYQTLMGGVDVHDRLRLQWFSPQTFMRFKKYYKNLFLGFLDIALVNAYISYKESMKINGTQVMTRGVGMECCKISFFS